MVYSEFVKALKNGTYKIDVVRSIASRAVSEGYLPRRYLYVRIFLSCAWVLSFPAGFAIMFFQKWWIGIFFLIFIPALISAAIKKSVFTFIVKQASEHFDFYNFAIANELICIEKKKLS